MINLIINLYIFLRLHSRTQILTTRTHTAPCEYTYANSTPVSISEGLSTGNLEILRGASNARNTR
jgi:hypothetical protein